MARPKYQARLDAVVDQAVDVGVEAVFDRVQEFFSRQSEAQRARTVALPMGERLPIYKCSGCHKSFKKDDPKLFLISEGEWGMCHDCHRFMWTAGKEKLDAMRRGVGDFAKGAARSATGGAPRQPAQASGPLPHEILGVDIHASIEEINKAYRVLALKWHPDRVMPGEPTEKKDLHRAEFEKIDRAYTVMKKVRKVAT